MKVRQWAARKSSGQGEAYAENPQSRRENGSFENLNEDFSQDSEESPLRDQVGELHGGQIMKDLGHLFRHIVLILMAFGKRKQRSYMIRFSLQKYMMRYVE